MAQICVITGRAFAHQRALQNGGYLRAGAYQR